MNDLNKISKDVFKAPLDKNADSFPRGLFDLYPAFKLEENLVENDYSSLCEVLNSKINNGLRVLAVDGYLGQSWDKFIDEISSRINNGIKVNWVNVEECLNDNEKIEETIEPFLGGDDRIFGKHFPLSLEQFFNPIKLAELRIDASILRGDVNKNEVTIYYGIGAGLLEIWDELWYLDMPKDMLQHKFRNGKAKNFTTDTELKFETFYKRAYFIEWPALNRHKKRLLSTIDLFVDLQDDENPLFMNGNNFREALNQVSKNPFRVKPWFYPGPWGGKYMQGHMGLDPKEPNFAWSFELIVPENGVMLQSGNNKLEFSFDCLMFQEGNNVLGGEAYKQFKDEWPIRLDYLDTVNGGNLSAQVHPRPDYIRKEFGETYTQDETYYITNCKDGAKVYLGLKDDCEPEEFEKALYNSMDKGVELDVDKYINKVDAKTHDLFFIPNGTVHCSGTNNLVLEISATPYIFTFKVYDYLRRDLEGNLRPINIKRGFENIRFERREDFVEENLIAKPVLINEGSDWKEFELYNKPYTFYNVHRVEFDTEYELDTDDKGYAINLVEGEKVDVITEQHITGLAYLESMLVPAKAKKVKFVNKGESKCKLVLVYVKSGIGNTVPLNDPIK